MKSLFGIDLPQGAQWLISLAIILALIALMWLLLRSFANGKIRLRGQNARGRQPRLGVVDIFDLDRQRQLVLIRRDNVEHLILVGGASDTVIETNILRGARPAVAPQVAGDLAVDIQPLPAAVEKAPERLAEAPKPEKPAGDIIKPLPLQPPLAAAPPQNLASPPQMRAEPATVAAPATPLPTPPGMAQTGQPSAPAADLDLMTRQLEEALKKPFAAVRPAAEAAPAPVPAPVAAPAPIRAEGAKPETPKSEQPRAEAPRPATPPPGLPRAEPLMAQPPKPEAKPEPKADAAPARAEMPKVAQNKSEPAKSEPAKPEPAKAEPAKPERKAEAAPVLPAASPTPPAKPAVAATAAAAIIAATPGAPAAPVAASPSPAAPTPAAPTPAAPSPAAPPPQAPESGLDFDLENALAEALAFNTPPADATPDAKPASQPVEPGLPPPTKSDAPLAEGAKNAGPDPFSLTSIEAEFARLLGRQPETPPKG